ncbi:MAG: hypothetical protein K0M46_10175 [Thiobacillus sp.]|nr:hypothetical protein [Thiobacillus sp.]
MKRTATGKIAGGVALTAVAMASVVGFATAAEEKKSSYSPVVIKEEFAAVMARLKGEKPAVMGRQQALLETRYDLSNKPAQGVNMSGGKPVQQGVRAKLPRGVSWDMLAKTPPEAIREKGVFPAAFLPLPHPKHPEGGLVFPEFHIK